jgi:hypothetical protein
MGVHGLPNHASSSELSQLYRVKGCDPSLTTMALSLAMNEESSPARPPRIISGHTLNNLQDITFQLTARCAGLLEAKDGSKERHRQYTFFWRQSQGY